MIEYPLVKQEDNRIVVNSISLLPFLCEGMTSSDQDVVFAPYLDLSFFSVYFEELERQKQLVLMHDDVDAEQFKSIYKRLMTAAYRSEDPEALRNYLRSEGLAERSMTVYFDPRSKKVVTSDVNLGSYGEVQLDIAYARDFNFFPVMHIHTHPDDSFFSAVDYRAILVKHPFLKRRFFVSQVLVCPNIQILALATADTPLFNTPEQVEDFTEDLENRFKLDIPPAVEQLTELLAFHMRQKDLLKVQANIYGEEVLRLSKEYGLSAKAAYELLRDYDQFIKRQWVKYVSEGRVMLDLAKAEQFKASASSGMAIARHTGLKFYSSTDMKNFYEFSV